jgi:hypothetical protein
VCSPVYINAHMHRYIRMLRHMSFLLGKLLEQ